MEKTNATSGKLLFLPSKMSINQMDVILVRIMPLNKSSLWTIFAHHQENNCTPYYRNRTTTNYRSMERRKELPVSRAHEHQHMDLQLQLQWERLDLYYKNPRNLACDYKTMRRVHFSSRHH